MKGALLGSGLVFAEIFSHSAALTYHAAHSPTFWCSVALAGLGMIHSGAQVAQAIFRALTAGE
jgi:hypothetical protein